MARQRRLDQKRGWAFGLAAFVVKPVLLALTKRDWRDGMKVPATGGCVVAVNHLSHVDPLTLAHFFYDHGRIVRYLTKQELFTVPFVGRVATDAGQIPVARASHDALHSFDAAVRAVESGELVAFYPEGTITRDPDLWPMRGKLGAARVALLTGCPVVPVGHWGVQELLPPYGKPDLLPRKTIRVKAGDPVELDDLRERVGDQTPSREVLEEATDRIMAAITALVAELRDETAPAERFDPRKAGVRAYGNPNKRAQDGGA
ncbi:1-acyl-sn-glycerol-3-phosphate acyltransferase [Marmoricola endophyticus]|uniref:1-acyl-sn-glycerol-3-phosphate acyltransferase n=1 Tax=Marmoricola endophyticus TaxID=2040280 RepID=A0A917BG37_9ACTN|nr:lysophospholipid acyltransferase family protein [Marmoricola endophyticus]GGF39235.1 1-acyl-sn-glycerol-3-phosphate acyltransferase [Marmoricola endophyticus]